MVTVMELPEQICLELLHCLTENTSTMPESLRCTDENFSVCVTVCCISVHESIVNVSVIFLRPTKVCCARLALCELQHVFLNA